MELAGLAPHIFQQTQKVQVREVQFQNKSMASLVGLEAEWYDIETDNLKSLTLLKYSFSLSLFSNEVQAHKDKKKCTYAA